jgi:glucose-6-phosphate isomerase
VSRALRDEAPYRHDDAGGSAINRTTEVTAAGVTVTVSGEPLQQAIGPVLADAAQHDVAGRLEQRDPTLWGPEAESEAKIRLGWLDLPTSSRELLPRLAELRREVVADGLDHIVLAGMGGSSLAPEVITGTEGVELTVLDTTDPHQVRRALGDRLDRTLVVVASKSGGTVETDSQRRAYEQAFRDAGLSDAELGKHFVVVTDPGSALEETGRTAGYREVVLADPNVGGRYSALSAFGLVPSAIAGADVTRLLDDAAHLVPALAGFDGNPGLLLGAALGGGCVAGRDKLLMVDEGSGITGFGDWAEQLIAESTGKGGLGLLPVVIEAPGAPGAQAAGADAQRVSLGGAPAEHGITVSGPLGAQFLLWEYATAVAGRALGINPFDQPNVEESKVAARRLLDEGVGGGAPPVFTDGAVEVYGDADVLGEARDLPGALDALLRAVPETGYLAVLAYLDRIGDAPAAGLRSTLAARVGDRPVTFGWGPRFLHSTGQYHKGGPQVGAFLQVTAAAAEDLPVPGRPYTFGQLELAQASGDLGGLRGRGRPALRLHLLDRGEGLQQVLGAAGS